jgi:hypothetical protein
MTTLWQYLPKEILFTNNDDDDKDFQGNNLTKDINDPIFFSSPLPSFKYLGSSTKTRTTTTTSNNLLIKKSLKWYLYLDGIEKKLRILYQRVTFGRHPYKSIRH